MARRLTRGAAALTCLAGLWRQGHALCTAPTPASGTHYNGTAGERYSPGTMLHYSCDTGYSPNYNPATSSCLSSTNNWQPPDLKCELDVTSLVIAIVVALIGIIVFVFAIMWLLKRRRERDSRRIKRQARSNTYQQYELRNSQRQNVYAVNHGMTDIEMDTIGTPIGSNGNVPNGVNGHANGQLFWDPPSSRGQVTADYDTAILQRSRKSSATSRSSRTDNASFKGNVQIAPDYGDVEFGAPTTNLHNIKDIGSTVVAMAQPTMGVNALEMSLPMPDASSPTMTSDDNISPRDGGEDFNGLYASVDKSMKKKKRHDDEKETNTNNSNVVTVATIESDGGYSAVGSPVSSNFSAHEEALAGDSPYSDPMEDSPYTDIKFGGGDDGDSGVDPLGEDAYAVVKRVEEPTTNEDDVGALYASVKK